MGSSGLDLVRRYAIGVKTRLHSAMQTLREVWWGLTVFELYRETIRQKREYERLMNIFFLGQFLGLPLMNSSITLRLLPYLVSDLYRWKREQSKEFDFVERAPEIH